MAFNGSFAPLSEAARSQNGSRYGLISPKRSRFGMRRASLAARSLPCIRFLKLQTPIRRHLRPSKRPAFNNKHPFNATMAFLMNRRPQPSAAIKHLAPNSCPTSARKTKKAAHRCEPPCKTWNRCRQEGCIAGQSGTYNHTPPNAERPAHAPYRPTSSMRNHMPSSTGKPRRNTALTARTVRRAALSGTQAAPGSRTTCAADRRVRRLRPRTHRQSAGRLPPSTRSWQSSPRAYPYRTRTADR